MNKTETKRARGGILASLRSALDIRKKNRIEPIYDVVTLLVGFLLSRAHVIFGAHPLGLGLLALLPSRVWVATLGAVLGSLTLGKSGIIYAMISVIVVFLRVIISGTADKEKSTTFREGILLRMSASLIGGFIAAVYELLLSGLNMTTVAFGVSMVLIPPLVVFGCSGLFDGPTVATLLSSDSRVLSIRTLRGQERYGIIFYQCSALLALFILSFAVREYSFVGISVGYLISAFATLVVAKRFGSVRAMAVGFVMALPLSSELSAAFGLIGLVAGFLFSIGLVYGLVGGGVVLAVWGAYASGVSGLLSALPEYMIAALVAAPAVKHLSPEKNEEEGASAERELNDMLGTVALSYKSKYSGSLDALAISLSSLAAVVGEHTDASTPPREAEVRSLIIDVAEKYVSRKSPYASIEGRVELPPMALEAMVSIVMKNGKVTPAVFEGYPSFAELAEGIADSVNRAVSILREERFRAGRESGYGEYLELLSKLLSEARVADEGEKSVNDELSLAVPTALERAGLTLGVGKVFGRRRPHLIIAAEDESGKRISSPELKSALEELTGRRLATPEFFRRGRMALMECSAAKAYAATAAYAACPRDGESVSGDTVRFLESENGMFRALISDGVGSGEDAERASRFVTEFLSASDGSHTALRLVNHIIRKRGEEYAATVDLFTLDLYTGEAWFMKSGAAVSYVKRGASIFRIKSRTSPLGVLKNAECERIKVEVQDGDLIVMASDGVSAGEDNPRIYELLSKAPPTSLSDYAALILKEAKRHTAAVDDMTVAVVKITRK